MNVLVACEESQRVCIAFRKQGFRAFSCDIVSQSGGHPEWHIYSDVRSVLARNIIFKTENNERHFVNKWDLIIAHPPCTYLTVTGNRYFNIERYGQKAIERIENRKKAFEFFMMFVNADCEHIAIENPIGYISTHYRKPDQIIQPYFFGDNQRKATCLWLKGLPLLRPDNIVKPEIIHYKNGKGTDNPWHLNTLKLPKEERTRERSKTFPGIANAMAAQWGTYLDIIDYVKDDINAINDILRKAGDNNG